MAFNVKPNILHDFASYTYNFKLYMVPLDEYNKVVNADSGIAVNDIHTVKFSKKVVLLESGATTTGINNVSITSMTSVDFSETTRIRMQCLQTKGFSFFETIIKAAELCGVQGNSIQSANMFLELTFVGITDTGVTKQNIFTVTYPVMIASINTNITNTGASYDINFHATSYSTTEDSFSVTPTIITMTDVNDLASFFTRFENGINEAYRRDTTAGQSQVNTCKFIVDPEILSYSIKNDDGTSPVFDYSMDYDGGTGASFNIPSDTAIQKVIEGVLSNIPEIIEHVLNDDVVAKVIHVEPVVTSGEFIPSMNTYTKNIKWYVRFKTVYKNTNADTMDVNKQIKLLAENGDLSKAYDYYYTGENTEVISMDIDLSSLYATTIQAYQGIFSNYSNQVGFAPSTITDQDELLERESSESQKSNNKYVSKPAYTDGSGSEVFYVDDYEKVDMELVKRISPRFVKKNTETDNNTSYTSATSNSERNQYMTVLNNIRNLSYIPSTLGKVAMEIRGDTHWLAPKNIYIKPSDVNSNPRMFNLIYVRVGFPIDETKDKVHIDEFMSKMYQVSSVISEFNNGKFTQKLTGHAIVGVPKNAVEKMIKRD